MITQEGTLRRELDTVLGSNLSRHITPDFGIQQLALKEHLGVDNFAFV